ncbi:hypothetical protein WICMUC_001864 [Wickerhamomyces mucosus]|uniref:C2H2-type domain-containing protein n=1 Tax=Wickerhamomyces mucosus TaxID=1378264 RepID=A0A9P8PTG2_9ASCO|nr:hypothetical protein WICMUC_001864 [Wickerhamomyces mucosus]
MSHNINSIASLINSDNSNSGNHDEDRKFLRAAAEAIVATSMNNEIDPTILELLKRIQYANTSPDQSGGLSSHGNRNNHHHHHQHHHDNDHNGHNGHNHNNNHNLQQQNSVGNNSIDFNFLNQNNNNHKPNSNYNFLNNSQTTTTSLETSHFPNFNLNYFDNLTKHRHTNSITPSASLDNTSDSSSPQRSNSITEKPFICSDCSLSFRRSSDLRRHQRAHLPILPHICQLCGKGFARKDALKRHSDTLTCKRNREKLINSGGDLEKILKLGDRR